MKLFARCLIAILAVFAGAAAVEAAPTHPLDPLQPDEMPVLKQVLDGSGRFTSHVIYSWAQLKEPPKATVLAWRYGQPFQRHAYVVAIDRGKKTSFEATVDLRAKKLLSLRDLKRLQPFLAESEFDAVAGIIDADARIKQALAKRGFVIPGKVSDVFYLDPYAPGEDEWLKKHPTRAIRVLFADKRGAENIYGPYVEGVMALVDLHGRKVARLVDRPGAGNPRYAAPHDIFSRKVLGPPREALKPLEVSQPQGASYTLKGNRLQWQGWDFRFSFNLREGLVLHQVGFREGAKPTGRLRPVLYRAAVSEMLVPYTDPSATWLWREFFDEGEYGLGFNSSAVRAGKELPANARTLPAILPDEAAEASTYEDRIYIYERDAGPLIFHKQWTDERRVYARGRELVIGFVSTLGNYDYFYNWVFRQDGSFQFASDLEGLILNKTVKGDECQVCKVQRQRGPGQTYEATGDERFGTLVHDHVLGVNHQHWINLRLDFDVDGPVNAVKECNTKPLPRHPRMNPLGRAFGVTHTVFAQEAQSVRNMDMATNRSWVVYNPRVVSRLGHPSGYEIVPGTNTQSMMPESRFRSEVGFTMRHFWATVNKPAEMHAAGMFPNQAPPGYRDALPFYAGKESVFKKDLVVWYSLGYTHVTKPEDYPIMPAGHVAVDFKPKGFFEKSPVLDLVQVE